MNHTKEIERILDVSNLYGVSGFEDEVVHYVRNEWRHLGSTDTDSIKNLYLNVNKGKQYTIQLDAHSDEVGFIVQAIRPNGLLTFLPVGGWIPSNSMAQKVKVRNNQGTYVTGIVTSKPPHFMTDSERKGPIKFEHLAIDIGAISKEDAETRFHLSIGAPVVPDVVCEYHSNTGLFLGKAFDCRIGVACMMDVLNELKDEDNDANLVATLTAQEEVGLRGAEVAAKKVQADLAIVFEGCPADDTSAPDYLIQSGLGKGPMLRYFDVSMITNPEWQNYAIQLAKSAAIPIQVSVRSGGGTNGAAINRFNGAPAIVVGIPVRYAHTPHCYVDYADYQAAKELVIQLIRSLTTDRIEKLIKPLG
ncbi:MAG: M42 family metallopeptidase [Vagococcus sp.]